MTKELAKHLPIDAESDGESIGPTSSRSRATTTSQNSSEMRRFVAKHRDTNRFVKAFDRVPLMVRIILILSVPVIFLLAISGELLISVKHDEKDMQNVLQAASAVSVIKALHRGLSLELTLSELKMDPRTCRKVQECNVASLTEARSSVLASLEALNLFVSHKSGLIQKAASVSKEVEAGLAFLNHNLESTRVLVDSSTLGITASPGTSTSSSPPSASTTTTSSSAAAAAASFVSATTAGSIRAFYLRVSASLVTLVGIFDSFIENRVFGNELLNLTEVMDAQSSIASLLHLAVRLWDGGPENPDQIESLGSHLGEISQSKARALGRTSGAEKDSVLQAFGAPGFVEALGSIKYIMANRTDVLRATGRSTDDTYKMFASAFSEFEALSGVLVAKLKATAAHSISAKDKVLVGTGLGATIFTCTFLMAILIASIRYQNARLLGSLLKVKATDVTLRKFIPTKFMNLLDVTDPLKLVPGMSTPIHLTMLFCDIRGFTSASEVLPPTDLFNLLLEYTKLVNPIISSRGGFVDKWVGDGLFAVFMDGEEAVYCALDIQAAVRKLNIERSTRLATQPVFEENRFDLPAEGAAMTRQHARSSFRSAESEVPMNFEIMHTAQGSDLPGSVKEAPSRCRSPPMLASRSELSSALSATNSVTNSLSTAAEFKYRVGIGIHTGEAVAGILGNHERVDCTLIGDAVNVAARLEALCGKLNCDILVSEATFSRLSNSALILHRPMGKMNLPGHVAPVAVYEIFECNDEPARSIKRKNSDVIQRATLILNENQNREAAIEIVRDHIDSTSVTYVDTVAEATLEAIKKGNLGQK